MSREEFRQKFAQNLKGLLKDWNIRQQDFAESIGMGYSTLKKYLNPSESVMPDIYQLYSMCMRLDIDPDELMCMSRFNEKTLADFTTDELLAEIKRRIEAS